MGEHPVISTELLVELCLKWERDSKPPHISSDDALSEAACVGYRDGLRECAATLRTIIGIFAK
jgi:hypothetical protein